MRKPSESETKSANRGGWTPPKVGGHYVKLLNVEPYKSKTGKEMMKICFDFAENDEQANYFAESYKNDTRDNKKWSFQATKYIMLADWQQPDKYSRNFMTFISCVEKSNTGFKTNWELDEADFFSQFRNKKIGAVFGIVENEYNGKRSKRSELRWWCGTDAVADASVPEEKLLEPSTSVADTDFMNIDVSSDDLPFN